MTTKRESAHEFTLLVESWEDALAAAFGEAGVAVVGHDWRRVEDWTLLDASTGGALWWRRRSATAPGDVALGFGPMAQFLAGDLARTAGAGTDFMPRIVERAAGLAGQVMEPCDEPPRGNLHLLRFQLADGRRIEIALAWSGAVERIERRAVEPFTPPRDRMGILLKMEVPVTILLGKANLPLKETLKLGRGSVVEFDRSFNEMVEVVVNGRVVARGDIVVVEEKYAVRIREVYRDASTQACTGAGAGVGA